MINIHPYIYVFFYTHLILFLILFTIISLLNGDIRNKDYSKWAFTFAMFQLFYIGLRPINVPGVGAYFGDTANYYNTFDFISKGGHIEVWSDPLWGSFTEFCARIMPAQAYFLILAALYIIPNYIAIRRLNNDKAFILLLGMVASMLFLSNGVNGIRAGIGSSFVLLGITLRDRKLLMWVVFFIAIGFHKSMVLPVFATIISSIYTNYKVYIFFWFFSIVLSLLFGGFWENFFASFTIGDERFSAYLTSEVDPSLFRYTGFRWDFLFYSSIPVFAGVYYINKFKLKESHFLHLFNTYLIANSFWILVIRANYSNRFAALSWFLVPLVLIIPLIEDKLWYNRAVAISLSLLVIFAFNYYTSLDTLWR